jgi:hypothetical protein
MKRKSHKVEEPAAPYAAKRTAKESEAIKKTEPAMRFADLNSVRKNNAELMRVHRQVLQKLAQ